MDARTGWLLLSEALNGHLRLFLNHAFQKAGASGASQLTPPPWTQQKAFNLPLIRQQSLHLQLPTSPIGPCQRGFSGAWAWWGRRSGAVTPLLPRHWSGQHCGNTAALAANRRAKQRRLPVSPMMMYLNRYAYAMAPGVCGSNPYKLFRWKEPADDGPLARFSASEPKKEQ